MRIYSSFINYLLFLPKHFGFKFPGNDNTTKYTIKIEPILSSRLLNNFGINDAAKIPAPLCFKNITATSDIVPVSPPYTAIPIGVPHNPALQFL